MAGCFNIQELILFAKDGIGRVPMWCRRVMGLQRFYLRRAYI